jgi:hypothetical protein
VTCKASTEATVTSIPARRRVSMMHAASISSGQENQISRSKNQDGKSKSKDAIAKRFHMFDLWILILDVTSF